MHLGLNPHLCCARTFACGRVASVMPSVLFAYCALVCHAFVHSNLL